MKTRIKQLYDTLEKLQNETVALKITIDNLRKDSAPKVKQSTPLEQATVWHAGTNSFYDAILLKPISPEDVRRESQI
jgi:hypothetical protein